MNQEEKTEDLFPCTKNIEELFGMSAEQFDFFIRCEYNVLNIVNVKLLKSEELY